MRRIVKQMKQLTALVVALTLAFLAPTVAMARQNAPAGEPLLHEESFRVDRELTGLIASLSQAFFTGDWEIEEASLTLVLSATPLVREEVSDFTLSLNGRPVYSERIPLTKGEVYQSVIDLPAEAILEGANTLVMESYIRTNETDACVEDVSQASWLSVLADSYISVRYKSRAEVVSVGDLYSILTSIEALENEESVVYLPANPGDAALTAAGYALAGVSGNAPLFYENLRVERVSNAADLAAGKYGVYFARSDELFPEIAAQFSPEQLEAAETGALLRLVDTGGSKVLVVTAADDASLVRAGQLFGNRQYMEQTPAEWRKVFPDEIVTFEEDDEALTRDLSVADAYLAGPFRREQTFFIDSYANRSLKPGSVVDLDFRYSENLDFDRSLITVYLNDVPVGSKKLAMELANGDTASFELPTTTEISGPFSLRVAFDLEIKDLACTLRQDEMPWGYISGDSSVTLYTEEIPYLLFDYFPSPFIVGGKLNDVAVVLPYNMAAADLDVFRGVLLTLGRYMTNNSGALRVSTEATMGELSTENLISIGRYENNAIARQINNEMFFQFTPEGTTIRPNEKVAIEPNYGSTLGSGQLLYSPYSTEPRALLLLSGVTDEGMTLAGERISSTDNIWQLSGDGYIADSENAYFYRFKADNAVRASSLQKFFATPQLVLAASVVAGVVLLIVIVVVALLLKHGRRGRYEEK